MRGFNLKLQGSPCDCNPSGRSRPIGRRQRFYFAASDNEQRRNSDLLFVGLVLTVLAPELEGFTFQSTVDIAVRFCHTGNYTQGL